jgi:hypothetical protein
MGRRELVHVVSFAAGGGLTVEPFSLPGGLSDLEWTVGFGNLAGLLRVPRRGGSGSRIGLRGNQHRAHDQNRDHEALLSRILGAFHS